MRDEFSGSQGITANDNVFSSRTALAALFGLNCKKFGLNCYRKGAVTTTWRFEESHGCREHSLTAQKSCQARGPY